MPEVKPRSIAQALGWLALLALLLSGCRKGRPVTREECDRLLERYTEMLARADEPKLGHAELERVKDEVRARASKHPPFLACTREVSREQMDCALAAWNPDEIERCLVPMP